MQVPVSLVKSSDSIKPEIEQTEESNSSEKVSETSAAADSKETEADRVKSESKSPEVTKSSEVTSEATEKAGVGADVHEESEPKFDISGNEDSRPESPREGSGDFVDQVRVRILLAFLRLGTVDSIGCFWSTSFSLSATIAV